MDMQQQHVLTRISLSLTTNPLLTNTHTQQQQQQQQHNKHKTNHQSRRPRLCLRSTHRSRTPETLYYDAKKGKDAQFHHVGRLPNRIRDTNWIDSAKRQDSTQQSRFDCG